jgi:hypothetical protein
MKSPIRFALLAALPLEVANYLFVTIPVEGPAPAETGLRSFLAAEWTYFHLPGLLTLGWFHRAGLPRIDGAVLFVSGYLTTALTILLCLFAFNLLKRLARRFSFDRD